jgi:hypothetical protein
MAEITHFPAKSVELLPTTPVLAIGGSGAWDDNTVADAKVIKVGAVYHMWYNGNDVATVTNKIGHATSFDGITWTKDPANPVLSGSSGWDSVENQSPGVFYDPATGIFHMWYVGDSGDESNEALGYAYSLDGTNWTKGANNPVLIKVGDEFIGDTLDAYKDGNTFRVLYGHFDLSGAAERDIYEATVTVPDIGGTIPDGGGPGAGKVFLPAVSSAATNPVIPTATPTAVQESPSVTVTPTAIATATAVHP